MTKRLSAIFTFFTICGLIFTGCKKPYSQKDLDDPVVPDHAPNYSKSSNDELVLLGRVLFFDKKLSSDNSISCGSCHSQENAFADDQALSNGVSGQKTSRNAPSIFPKNGKMFWDGRARNLQEMVIMPITNTVEMNIHDFDGLCKKLNQTSYYPKLFKRAYNNESITKDKIAGALKEFVTNFDFSNNKFRSNMVPGTLSAEEEGGKNLFFGKAKCVECHHIDNNFSNNGYGSTDEAHNIGLDDAPNDMGVGDITKDEKHNGQFMMPVLLNVELTSPYMHDGRFLTLEQVIEHYNSEVKTSPTLDWRLKDFSDCKSLSEARMKYDTNRDGNIDNTEAPNRKAQKLDLTSVEKAQLVSFLKALTDKTILTDTKFADPFDN